MGDPRIFFKKKPDITKALKTLSFLTCFEKGLTQENLQESSKILRVQYAVVFVLLLLSAKVTNPWGISYW